MFEKRIHDNRKNRFFTRGRGNAGRKEAGHNNTDGHASDRFVLLKHEFIRLYRGAVHFFKGKGNNDPFIIDDGCGKPLEFKNNERQSLERSLSDLSLQLNLYLNSGLVISAAFEELVKDCRDEGEMSRFLAYVEAEARRKNMAFENQLLVFAKELKIRNLLRFASLIIDNRSKGTELADKLERERLRMQSERLSAAKGKTKEAETRLCFPLMLYLIVLVIICIAPAMMNM